MPGSGTGSYRYDGVGQARVDQGVKFAKVVVGFCRFLLEDSLQAVCAGIYLCKQWHKVSVNTQVFTFAQIFGGVLISFAGPLREYMGIEQSPNGFFADATKTRGPGRFDGDDGILKVRAMQCVLTIVATIYWGSMAAYSFTLGDDITCDGDNPSLGVYLFLGFLIFDLFLQTSLAGRGLGWKQLLEGAFFTCLARWDTFSDVVFTARVSDCNDITWFSVHGHVFYLPFGLTVQSLSLFALVVGVFLFQAFPALVLIAWKGLSPLALKFNDFNIILAGN